LWFCFPFRSFVSCLLFFFQKKQESVSNKMSESGHAPARVVGGVRIAPAHAHAHNEEGTAQTTLVSALDGNANNDALVNAERPPLVFEAQEKKKKEGKKDPKVPKHDKVTNFIC
jgi:hypothetical protein